MAKRSKSGGKIVVTKRKDGTKTAQFQGVFMGHNVHSSVVTLPAKPAKRRDENRIKTKEADEYFVQLQAIVQSLRDEVKGKVNRLLVRNGIVDDEPKKTPAGVEVTK